MLAFCFPYSSYSDLSGAPLQGVQLGRHTLPSLSCPLIPRSCIFIPVSRKHGVWGTVPLFFRVLQVSRMVLIKVCSYPSQALQCVSCSLLKAGPALSELCGISLWETVSLQLTLGSQPFPSLTLRLGVEQSRCIPVSRSTVLIASVMA